MVDFKKLLENKNKMANSKRTRTTTNESNGIEGINTMPETITQRKRVGEKNINFYPFVKGVEAYFTKVKLNEETFDNPCYNVIENNTLKEYYLPHHKQLVEAFEQGDENSNWAVTLTDIREYQKGNKTQTFYTYDIFLLGEED